jgi:hypothetical protein
VQGSAPTSAQDKRARRLAQCCFGRRGATRPERPLSLGTEQRTVAGGPEPPCDGQPRPKQSADPVPTPCPTPLKAGAPPPSSHTRSPTPRAPITSRPRV